MLKTRQQLEKEESSVLAPYAMKSGESAGRVHDEEQDVFRLAFQCDRDRILHSKSFRRLQAKTQVFVSYFGDHYRDRMTHSIEVSQIARGISRTLGLNEDLSEALALAHDLGHPPFGHGGEKALDDMMRKYGLQFEHNEQSRRIVEKLEKIHPTYDGLNLTKEVLDGLLKHNPHKYHTYLAFEISAHLEGQVVDCADEIAYTNHDIDDGLRSGLISTEELSQFELWQEAEQRVREKYEECILEKDDASKRRFTYRIISSMINRMINDLQNTISANLEEHGIDSIEKVRSCKKRLVCFSDAMQLRVRELRGFLMKHFYLNEKVADQIEKGKEIVKKLFQYYLDHPEDLPRLFYEEIEKGEDRLIIVKDYIAGMTDHFAEEQVSELGL